MKTSEKIDQILPQLFAVKSKLKAFAKDSANPFFNSSYVDLNSLLEEIDPLLAQHDLLLLQPVNKNSVESVIMHTSGQFVASEMDLVLGKSTMQEAGSAVTYGRRYTLKGLLGLRDLDDDGNVASGLTKQAPKSYSKPAAKPAAAAPVAAKVSTPALAPTNETLAPAAPAKKAFPFKAGKPAPVANGVDASQFD